MRNTNPELALIHAQALLPLVQLMEANFNYYNFKNLLKTNPDLPDFRRKALEEKFIEWFTKVCDILAAYPSRDDEKKLEDYYDIAQMLRVLKTDDWEKIEPLCFFMMPLQNQLDEVIKILLEMRRLGVLRCKYYIEENRKLQLAVIDLIKKDVTVQWLAGDELKRDQFKFIHKVHEIIYESPIKDEYLRGKQDSLVIQEVIPQLTVFRAMLTIRDINDRKKAFKDKE